MRYHLETLKSRRLISVTAFCVKKKPKAMQSDIAGLMIIKHYRNDGERIKASLFDTDYNDSIPDLPHEVSLPCDNYIRFLRVCRLLEAGFYPLGRD